MNFQNQRTLVVYGLRTAIVGCCLLWARESPAQDGEETGEKIVCLGSGKTDACTYSLYHVGTATDESCDLILVVKNTGAKYINLKLVTPKHFKLTDSAGGEIEIALDSQFRGVAYGSRTVAHLAAYHERNKAPQPWTLKFDSGNEDLIRVAFTIEAFRVR